MPPSGHCDSLPVELADPRATQATTPCHKDNIMSTATIVITGRLARDPETRTSASGTTTTKLTLPVDSGWGEKKTTTWWTCFLFGKRAEAAARYLSKGGWVSVTGTPELNTWDKKDGTKGYNAQVTVNDWSFVGPKQQGGEPTYPSDRDVNRRPRYDQGNATQGMSEDDLPF